MLEKLERSLLMAKLDLWYQVATPRRSHRQCWRSCATKRADWRWGSLLQTDAPNVSQSPVRHLRGSVFSPAYAFGLASFLEFDASSKRESTCDRDETAGRR